MITLFSHNRYLADLLGGFRDVHCHLLPGVDDGSPDAEHSHRMLEALHALGVEAVYFTPHMISGAYGDRSAAELRQAFEKFDCPDGVEVRLAAEYFVDDRFLAKLADGALTMRDRHILAEFSLNGYSVNSFDLLFEACVSGFQVILAHPERYSFVRFDAPDKVLNLVKQYELQLNLLSLTGFYGTRCRKLAQRLLDENFYTFVGTDIHSEVYIDALKRAKVSRKTFDALRALADNNNSLF